MANVRDSDTSLWLHNKLGTSNDSWTSGSICSQLNKEVLRNIKDCFPDLQTQVKLKLLLSFFDIPRRLIEEWKTELEEIIDTAGVDSELWVAMLAETMKTLPATGSLNTEISDYEETRPIFTDMVNDLKKLVTKHSDLGMLPLECQYLNKAALTSMVGQQPAPIKHFTLKRKPKSAALRAELLQKSCDAQSTLKKVSAPTIPLRSRGMPRKMTDTTPLKGIPSRVPTSGFRSPPSMQSQNRPNFSRMPAGRKDGGIKLLEITEQPLGYAAAKKRKRQQELEEQQKKSLENQSNTSPTSAATPPVVTTSATPDYAAGLTATAVYTQPPTPSTSTVKTERPLSPTAAAAVMSPITPSTTNNHLNNNIALTPTTDSSIPLASSTMTTNISSEQEMIENDVKPDIKQEITSYSNVEEIQTSVKSYTPATSTTIISSTPKIQKIPISSSVNQPNIQTITQQVVTQPIKENINKIIISSNNNNNTNNNNNNNINSNIIDSNRNISKNSNIIITNKNSNISIIAKSDISSPNIISTPTTSIVKTTQAPIGIQTIMSSQSALANNIIQIPRQTTITQIQKPQQPTQAGQTKIVQIKTTPTIAVSSGATVHQNIPPLIPTMPTSTSKINIQNIQNVNIPLNHMQLDNPNAIKTNILRINPPTQTTTIKQIPVGTQQTTITSSANIIQQQQTQQQTIQQPKIGQFVVQSPSNVNVKGKTIILTNPNQLTQNGVIIRSIGPTGNTVYQQVPLSNVTGLTNIINTGPPGLVKTEQKVITQNQMPTLVSTSNYNSNIPSLTPVVISSNVQQQTIPALLTTTTNQQQKTAIVRPVKMSNVQGVNVLPQGLTIIQRPGQQPQLVQISNQPTIQRTIITQQPNQQEQIRPQTIYVQQQPVQNTQTTQQSRKGLSLTQKCYFEAHEMFKNANAVTRLDKALILGFMAGYKENPRPTPENTLVIKLGDTKEKIMRENGSYVLTSVESFVKLDYNTGEWKTFKETTILDQHHEDSNPSSNSVVTN